MHLAQEQKPNEDSVQFKILERRQWFTKYLVHAARALEDARNYLIIYFSGGLFTNILQLALY